MSLAPSRQRRSAGTTRTKHGVSWGVWGNECWFGSVTNSLLGSPSPVRVSVFSAVHGSNKPRPPSFLSTVGVKPGPGLWRLKSQDRELSSALPGPVPERSVAPSLPFFAWSSRLSVRPSVQWRLYPSPCTCRPRLAAAPGRGGSAHFPRRARTHARPDRWGAGGGGTTHSVSGTL